MAKKAKPPSGSNVYKPIGVRPDDELRAALAECARRERRDITPMCVILLEEALAARGLWPYDKPEES